jgi:hypothetical protein
MTVLFLRLVKGNALNPGIDNGIGIHSFIGSLDAWERGEISKNDVMTAYSLTTGTATGDEADIDLLKQWYNTATDQKLFIKVMKDRLYMGEDKSGDPDGYHGFAVKNTFLNGADGSTPLSGF